MERTKKSGLEHKADKKLSILLRKDNHSYRRGSSRKDKIKHITDISINLIIVEWNECIRLEQPELVRVE